jgi:MFS family permease
VTSLLTRAPGASRPSRPSRGAGRLPDSAAFYLLASLIAAFLAGSSAPTPLYGHYASAWGFSAITTTVVFGVYAVAVLAALLTAGSLSDHIGRRPVLLAAIGAQAVAMVVFATASGVPELMVARIIQGLSTGAAAGAIGAGLLDLDKSKGTIANAVAPVTGTAAGALGSGLLVQYLPAPTRLVYLVLLAVFAVQAAGVLLMRETSAPAPGALASLRPAFTLPRQARGPFLVAIPALVAAWSLVGFYGSLGPTLIQRIAGSHSVVLGGLPLFVLAASGAVTMFLLHRRSPRTIMLTGASALLAGIGLVLLAAGTGSAAAFFIGTVAAGAGVGGGFQGAIRSVVPLAAPHERAGVLSVVYVVSYLAMGVPAVIAGFLVVHDGSVLTTARQYGVAVLVLGALALIGSARPARPARQPAPAVR